MKSVLDTNAILYLLGGKLAEGLPAAAYYISVISEIEVLSYPSLDASAYDQIQEFLSAVTVIGLDDEVKDQAIRLRRQHQLKLPDAIVAATALSLGARLITNDTKLLRVPGLRSEKLKLKGR